MRSTDVACARRGSWRRLEGGRAGQQSARTPRGGQDEPPSGGAELGLDYLSRELDQIGYETLLVAGRVGPGEGSMEHVARADGIEPVFVPALRREISPVVDAAAAFRGVSGVRFAEPDYYATPSAIPNHAAVG